MSSCEVGRYAYNDANTLVTEIGRVLAEQLFEDSTDGMKGLLSTAKNTLIEYKSHISVKRRYILEDSQETADCLSSSSGTTVLPEITSNSDAQEEAGRMNTYRLAVIGVKEGVAEKTSPTQSSERQMASAQICGRLPAPPAHHRHHRRCKRPEATTIRHQFVNIAGMVFNWRDTVAINIKKIATNAAKTQAYGIRVHNNLKTVIILANVEWAACQLWGTEISVAHRTIKAKYIYNHSHDTNSIKEILKVLTEANKARDRRKAMAPGEKAEMVSQGMENLQQLVQR